MASRSQLDGIQNFETTGRNQKSCKTSQENPKIRQE
jgi:hypothetical protein